MDVTNINLFKSVTTLDSNTNLKSTSKEYSEVSKNFQNYLDKSKKDIKQDNTSTNKLENEESKKNLDDNLEKALNEIENIIKNGDTISEKDEDLDQSVSEVISLLLNYFTKINNEFSEEFNEFEFNNINLENILDEIYSANNINTENILNTLSNIKNLIDKKLNITDISDINPILNLMEETNLDEELLNQVNILIKDIFSSNKTLKEKLEENDNLEIINFVKYLEDNSNKESLSSEFEINTENLDILEKVNIVKGYKDDLDSDFNNTYFNIEDKKYEDIPKEEDFLNKILSEDLNNKNTSNYYNKLPQNNFFNNLEVLNEPISVSKENISTDIIKNIKYMIMDSIEELSVKIYPKELGELTIKILSEEGIMKAEIKATSKETYNLLNANINDIKKNLEDQNIKIQEVNIGIYNEDTTFFSGRENKDQSPKYFNEDINSSYSYDEDEFIEEVNFDNNINYLA